MTARKYARQQKNGEKWIWICKEVFDVLPNAIARAEELSLRHHTVFRVVTNTLSSECQELYRTKLQELGA